MRPSCSSSASLAPLLPPSPLAVRRCADGSALPTVATAGGRVYVVSEEGCEFDVELRCGPGFPMTHDSRIIYGVRRG
jgi:hypothetical protein